MQLLLQSWPLAMVICFLAALIILRAPIADLVGRITRLSHKGSSVEVAPGQSVAHQQEQAEKQLTRTSTSMVPASHAMPPPVEVYAPIELQVRKDIEHAQLPTEVQMAWLIRGIATLRVQLAHEMAYRLILGSQISILLLANSSQRPGLTRAREIYETARVNFPETYKNFAFEPWLNFPIGAHFVIWETSGVSQILSITPQGRDFLHYLVNSGLTSEKYG